MAAYNVKTKPAQSVVTVWDHDHRFPSYKSKAWSLSFKIFLFSFSLLNSCDICSSGSEENFQKIWIHTLMEDVAYGLTYGLPKENVTAIIVVYKNTKIKVRAPDEDTDFF